MLRSFGEMGADMLSLPTALFVAIQETAAKIKAAGLHVSAGSWVDREHNQACVFSRECNGPYCSSNRCYVLTLLDNGEVRVC